MVFTNQYFYPSTSFFILKTIPLENYFTTFIDIIGTFTFAISGIRLASGKQLDWFGAYIIGLVTAVGGGTIRDVLLDLTPFWMVDSKCFAITGVALLATVLFKDKVFKWANTLLLFDTIGLGLFTIIGISKSMDAQLPFWVCIIMGTITGSMGGVLRDVLLNEVPLLLRKDIYAIACLVGGGVYFLCIHLNFSKSLTELLAALIVIFVRLIAIKFQIHLPVLKSIETDA